MSAGGSAGGPAGKPGEVLVPGQYAGAVAAGSVEDQLRAEIVTLRNNLVAAESRASGLTAEVEKLKAAIEAAKPPPSPELLAEQFASQRGLEFEPPPVWKPSPVDAILEEIRKGVEAVLTAESAAARGRAALAMGLHSDPFDYREAVISLAQMTSGGFYREADNTFLYREEANLSRADGRETFIGGLSAALSKARAGMAGKQLFDTPNDDEALAARSLISGDANAARVRFSIADQLNLNFDRNGAPAAPPPNYSAPAYLAEIWKFSQDKGSLFVEALAGKAGNAGIDSAYLRLPRSSAEILHPEELYFANPPFQPVAVELKDPAVGGVAPYFVNTAGEFGTYIILRSWLDMDSSSTASEGWAGDRYAVWAGQEGVGDHFFWKTVWRTEKDAQEFFEQEKLVLMQRFSIPWRKEWVSVPNQFRVDDPRRVIRLTLSPDKKSVTCLHATDPAFAAELEKVSAAW